MPAAPKRAAQSISSGGSSMNKIARTIVLMLTCAVLGIAQEQTPGPAKPQNTMQTLKQLEHDWTEAEKAADTDKLGAILADDWIGLGFDGWMRTKEKALAELKSGTEKIESVEFGPMNVKVLGNVAVVRGTNTEKSSDAGKDNSGKWAWMDVFVKRDGKWVAVRSQSAKVK